MTNEDGSIWIVFNGEIYNFRELRAILEKRGHKFRTNSDTEAIIHLYEDHEGDCVRYLNGMFAFAIWDSARHRLMLARDRLGKKPLVYALSPTALTFASEIGALLQGTPEPRELDVEALDLYLALHYVPNPWTMLKGIRKLEPAHYLLCEKGDVRINRYWDLDFTTKFEGTLEDAAASVRSLFEDSVRRRLISDVPLGAFLSGGVDSSAVVATMARASSRPVRTFSVGFDDDAYGELPYAREVAERYGTEHNELRVKPDTVGILPRLVEHYGEPFGDSSAVATYYLSKFARESVTVALSGDGGDELFGGYPWYVDVPRHAALAGAYLRNGSSALVAAVRERNGRGALGAIRGAALGLKVAMDGWRAPSTALLRYTAAYGKRERCALYTGDLRAALEPRDVAAELVAELYARQRRTDTVARMLDVDHHLYLPGDILVKMDIASMANSLEVRSPFLDYRLVDLAASLPSSMKVRRGASKRVLRKALAELLPVGILKRPKVGFGLPIDEWMRGELYEFARDALLDSTAKSRGLFDARTVERLLNYHKKGIRNDGRQLWVLLVFEVWCRGVFDHSKGLAA
jgi:asparagine synthase (glutamine-hydrolysing)